VFILKRTVILSKVFFCLLSAVISSGSRPLCDPRTAKASSDADPEYLNRITQQVCDHWAKFAPEPRDGWETSCSHDVKAAFHNGGIFMYVTTEKKISHSVCLSLSVSLSLSECVSRSLSHCVFLTVSLSFSLFVYLSVCLSLSLAHLISCDQDSSIYFLPKVKCLCLSTRTGHLVQLNCGVSIHTI
jgi:hypothetical protein